MTLDLRLSFMYGSIYVILLSGSLLLGGGWAWPEGGGMEVDHYVQHSTVKLPRLVGDLWGVGGQGSGVAVSGAGGGGCVSAVRLM